MTSSPIVGVITDAKDGYITTMFAGCHIGIIRPKTPTERMQQRVNQGAKRRKPIAQLTLAQMDALDLAVHQHDVPHCETPAENAG